MDAVAGYADVDGDASLAGLLAYLRLRSIRARAWRGGAVRSVRRSNC